LHNKGTTSTRPRFSLCCHGRGKRPICYAEAVLVADWPRRVAANNNKEFKEKAMLLS
jgi:hypothetical protein